MAETGCGNDKKADGAAANAGAENGVGKTATELVTEVVEGVEEKVNEYRDVTKLSLDDRRKLFQNYAKIFAGEGINGNYIICNQDGTVTLIGYEYETLQKPRTWTDIVQIAANQLFAAGLTTDGKLLYLGCEYDEEKGSNPAEWENIVGIVATRGSLFGLLEDGTIVGFEKVDAHCSEYDNVAGMHSDSSGSVVALTYDGRLLGEEKFCDLLGKKREGLNVKSFN